MGRGAGDTEVCFDVPPPNGEKAPLNYSSDRAVSTADTSTLPEAASTVLRLWIWQTWPLIEKEGDPPPPLPSPSLSAVWTSACPAFP